MLKKIVFRFGALILLSSSLSLSIVPFLGQDYDIVVLTETNEEEKNQENESEKKFNEKDFFSISFLPSSDMIILNKDLNHIGPVFFTSDLDTDIIVPPPRELS